MSDTNMNWVKSSRCHTGGCVELAALPDGGVALRDSKNPDVPPLRFTREEFAAFIAGAKNGEFRHLVT